METSIKKTFSETDVIISTEMSFKKLQTWMENIHKTSKH